MEEKEYLISVVIPVYNGEKFLRECVDSILSQTFVWGVEIVLVDDGSKDSSGEICDGYATLHDDVHVYYKQNEGINKTRRYGVRKAKGKWIAFCDQDDTLPIDALSSLWQQHEDTDIVIGFPDTPIHKQTLNLEECQENAITSKLFPPAPWAKLYRRDILTDDVFDIPREIDGEEDMIMNIRIMFKLSRAPKFVFRKVYNFRRNTASVSHTKKASLAHEELFHNIRSVSMPSWAQKKYLKATVFSRLNGLVGVGFREPEKICNKNIPFLIQLRKDIKDCKYKMNLQECLVLNLKSVTAYKFVTFLVMVKNSLKYRLGLNN